MNVLIDCILQKISHTIQLLKVVMALSVRLHARSLMS